MPEVEVIHDADSVLAYVIRASATSSATSFMTPDNAAFQVGFVVYPAGGEVVPHVHLPIERTVVGTSELLVVRTGRCYVDVYSSDQTLVATRELAAGDSVLSLAGGHGFRMIEDTVLLELKQGPFTGGLEKERFDRTNVDDT